MKIIEPWLMEMITSTIFWLILFHGRTIAATASHPGHISIDCGNETETADMTSVLFPDTGMNWATSEYPGTVFSTVTSFPSGNRSCYTLKPTDGGKPNRYLIRAQFWYGNYDQKNEPPLFDLYVGVNRWGMVHLKEDMPVFKEIIYKPTTDLVHVCLVNIGQGTPFISELVLMPLSDDIYDTGPALHLIRRYDTGSRSGGSTYKAYDDDQYDRFWATSENFEDLNITTTTSDLRNLKSDAYAIPTTIFQSKATPMSGMISVAIFINVPDDPSAKYYVYWHFAETEASEGRSFNIFLMNNPIPSVCTLTYMVEQTIYTPDPITVGTGDRLSFSINQTDSFSLPPILNAFEIFQYLNFSQLETNEDDVVAIMDVKKHYNSSVIKGWQGDPCLPIIPWDGLICSNSTNDAPRITYLNLSSKNLSGDLCPSISKLTALSNLSLSNNSLTGGIPEFLADLPNLKFLDLSENNFSGSVPRKLNNRVKIGALSMRLDGNPNLCISNSCSDKRKRNRSLVTLVACGLIIFLLIALAVFCACKWKGKAGLGSLCKSKNQCFTYSQLSRMTNNFGTVLGQGAFGTVYLGSLKDGTQVAVKMLKNISGLKSFQTEAELLMRVHHKNLVSLIGYCEEGKTMALIYEYMEIGDVQKYLSAQPTCTSSWKERLQISLDAAQGLDYLHSGCKPAIIHRDIKTANILLDEKLRAKVADLGMSRIFANESVGQISADYAAGTIGYLDPEYHNTGRLNEKSDVYSFGVVLLELITGRPAILKDTKDNNLNVITWVSPLNKIGDIDNILDQSFGGDFNRNSAQKAVEIAMACVSSTWIHRPTMAEVVAGLRECLTLEEKAKKGGDTQQPASTIAAFDIEQADAEASMGPSAR